MRMPPSVSPDWECAFDDIDVRISLHLGLEIPTAQHVLAHQVERARWIVAQRQYVGANPA
jgi:hypothetical protein